MNRQDLAEYRRCYPLHLADAMPDYNSYLASSMRAVNALCDEVERLVAENDKLRCLLREVSKQGVEESDTRMDWFNLQMSKELWAEIQEVLR